MISIILIEPKLSANVGAIARVMKNFNFNNLVLINPKCNYLSQTARNRAKHANDVLEKAKIKKINYLNQFDYLIATTAVLGSDYNIPRSPITPQQLADKLVKIDSKKKIGILIGREGPGLTNEEILKSDFVVSIPTSPRYGTMNISHAVAIILYEIFKVSTEKKINDHIVAASKKEKEIILNKINRILNKLEFATKEKKETQQKVWKRILGKSFLTKREAFALIGFFRKLEK
jgi:TrmH family RNA methyltransferase